ncbi:MAG TPA: DUF1841 family protein [Burkholderiaceae bacterium]|nr:DUF1841 family protein [Burkholderiaceae bacterium]
MFDPSQADVRRFFCEAWRKHRAGEPLEPIEAIAADWIAEHPEYHEDLASAQDAAARDYGADGGRTNPFLHLSMHLAITEQLQIDQPPGIRAAFERLARKLGSTHDAMHGAMECLGEMLWKAQRDGAPPDGAAYVDCVRRRAGA